MIEQKEMKGLYAKFIVLRVDNGQYVHACRAGVAAFAKAVREHNPILADDIQNLLRKLIKEKKEVADERTENISTKG